MKLIKTTTFELATISAGEENSKRLLLCLPGRLDTKDYEHMKSHVAYFGARGYLAVSFDPPGSWESPGPIEMYSMTNYLRAIAELIEYYGKKPTVLLGHSRGGSMAMLAAAKLDLVTHLIAVCSHAGPSEAPAGIEETGFYHTKRDVPGQLGEVIALQQPLSYFEDARQYDLPSCIKNSTKPKLFMYGTEDTIVDEEDVRTAFDLAAEPKELFELVGAIHDYRKQPEVITSVNERVELFLNSQ